MFQKHDKVWVRIVRINPVTRKTELMGLAPGIVIDGTEKTREVQQSATKGGNFVLNNSILVLSWRDTPSGFTYYSEKAERINAVDERKKYLPVIDGPENCDPEELLAALRKQAADDLEARLNSAKATEKQVEEIAEKFAHRDAFKFATAKAK